MVLRLADSALGQGYELISIRHTECRQYNTKQYFYHCLLPNVRQCRNTAIFDAYSAQYMKLKVFYFILPSAN